MTFETMKTSCVCVCVCGGGGGGVYDTYLVGPFCIVQIK